MITFTKTELPKGFEDKVGKDLRKQRIIEAIFRQVGYRKGYEEIETPIIERAEALPPELFACWKEQGFVKFDLKDYNQDLQEVGSTQVVLRPEGTIPVCRYLATQLANGRNGLPAKIIYSIDCYRNEPVEELNETKRRQFNQLGVENIGDGSMDADVEIIGYACEVMGLVGIDGPPGNSLRIRLNNIKLFKALCDESGFEMDRRYKMQDLLDKFSKARALGEKTGIELPTESVPVELQKKWRTFVDGYNMSLTEVSKIDEELAELTFELERCLIPVTVDLSVVRGFSYYTGPVFQIDVVKEDGSVMAEAGGGGRYDDLIGQNLKNFGIERKVPATGFAFGTERLVAASRLPKGKYSVEMII